MLRLGHHFGIFILFIKLYLTLITFSKDNGISQFVLSCKTYVVRDPNKFLTETLAYFDCIVIKTK